MIGEKLKSNINVKYYNANQCKNYLLLCNLPVPDTLKERREEVQLC